MDENRDNFVLGTGMLTQGFLMKNAIVVMNVSF